MKITDLLAQYLRKEVDAIATIRQLSGIFNPATATDLLVLINGITRIEQGDMDRETFAEVWKIKV